MLLRITLIFIYILTSISCVTKTPTSVDVNSNSKSVSGQTCSIDEASPVRNVSGAKMCADLFSQQNMMMQPEKIVGELAPGAITDGFWKVVQQLSLNSNSKIVLDTGGFTLTQASNGGARISANYSYDPPTNEFRIESIKFTKNGTTKEITVNNNGREFTDLELNDHIRSKIGDADPMIDFDKSVSYKVYEKIRDELANFNFFTSHELLKISKMEGKARVTKYSAILNTRKIKKFITTTLVEDFLYKPVRTFVISVLSIYLVSSQLDVGKHLGLTKEDVPTWVAPSIVNMTSHQSPAAQKEAVVLMKLINSNKSKEPKEDDIAKIKAKSVKINETDFYTIKKNNKDGRTYFILTHENENGNLDVFFQEINPQQFKALLQSSIN